MRTAVMGASGYLGTNLVEQLVTDGHEVVAIDKSPKTVPQEHVTWVYGDVLDRDGLTPLLEGCDLVINLAGRISLAHVDPLTWKLNVNGVRNIAEASLAAGVGRLVHTSSVHSFDQEGCEGLLDETSPRSTSLRLGAYDRSKWAGEQELQKVIARGLDAVICNPTGIYGPKETTAKLSRLNGILLDAAKGHVPAILPGGFDLVDVRDVAIGLILAGQHGRKGENYLLGGQLVTMKDICSLAARYRGYRSVQITIPMWVVRSIQPIAEPIANLFGSDVMSPNALNALVASPFVDCRKAMAELGYVPRPALETVRDLVTFFVEEGRLAPLTDDPNPLTTWRRRGVRAALRHARRRQRVPLNARLSQYNKWLADRIQRTVNVLRERFS